MDIHGVVGVYHGFERLELGCHGEHPRRPLANVRIPVKHGQ
jgi:hypothetical protein